MDESRSLPVPSPAQPDARHTWRLTAWVAGAFSVVLAGALLVTHLATRSDDPWRSPELKELKEKLRQAPKDEQVKSRIRELDLQLRETYFTQLSKKSVGSLMLLASVTTLLVALGRLRAGRRQLPRFDQAAEPSRAAREASLARFAVAGAGSLFAVFLLFFTVGAGSTVPTRGPAPTDSTGGAPTPDFASTEELRRNWPRFLGPDGNGFAHVKRAPLNWDAKTGAGILWTNPAPVAGFNSPIVWGDRIFFSGGDAAKREVVCLSSATGAVLWRHVLTNVPGSPRVPPEIPEMTGYAAPTMATDGRRVYVIFANGDLAGLSFEGQRLWAKNVGALKNPYGHANSLATWQDRVILQLDQGDSEEGKSKLVAVNGRNGQVAWEQPRKFGASWSSPTVFEHAGKPQIVLLSLPDAVSYSAVDGVELWRADCLNGEVTPSPIYAGGLVFIASPSDKLVAFRPDGSGNVSQSHLLWTNEDSIPDVTSPASNGELVFMVTTSGMFTCVDAKTGKAAWEHDLEMECHASPVIAGGLVYIFSQKGEVVVVESARVFKEVFRTHMPDSFHATPAVLEDRIFVRGMTNVWGLATPK